MKTMKSKNNHKTNRENAKKPVKSMRGIPEYYDECKKRYSLSLTPTAHKLLKDLANEKQLSLSELIEQIGRKKFLIKEQNIKK